MLNRTQLERHGADCAGREVVDRDPGSAGEESKADAGAAPARQVRVLVVDDEESIRLAIRIVLERRGHQVMEAESTRDGLERALSAAPDVALVDLRLPGNGLNLLRELDRMPALVGRTVLMTGSEDLLMDEQGNVVWPRWMAKPFDFGALVKLVERLAGEGPAAPPH